MAEQNSRPSPPAYPQALEDERKGEGSNPFPSPFGGGQNEGFFQRLWQRLHPTPSADLPPVGLHAYNRSAPGETARLHLRVDPDRSGVLIVNANRVLHLNPSASAMTYAWLENLPEKETSRRLGRQFGTSARRISDDYAQFASQLDELVRPDGACPIHELDLEITAPFSAEPSAPYRMDLALTYRCNDNCAHCYNARPRSFPELTTEEWKHILDQLWALGIPHVVFTGGEPTLRQDLPELIAHAERNGQITGINTNGRLLADPALVRRLVDAGLDHVQVTLESHDPRIHDAMVGARGAWEQTVQGIRNVLSGDHRRLYLMTNTTLLTDNAPTLGEMLDFLAALGVPTVGLNALIYSGRGLTVGKGLPESQLHSLLETARQRTDAYEQKLVWYTPTQYCNFDPVQMELGVKGCSAARYNMCVEPNGDVLPCQSYYHSLGNLLRDPWESIWNHELALRLRTRSYAPEKCQGCSFLPECGGGCPLILDLEALPAWQPNGE